MLPVKCGPELVKAIERAWRGDVPVMLHGKHGVGKSDVLQQAAAALGIEARVRDLTVLEPPDLLGLPYTGQDGRTHYAAPAFLPSGGKGLLVIEELNRAPRYMQSPCLQLLTAREIGDYKLPAGWLPCAAVNDGADGYVVDELDAALYSRFTHVRVVADVECWLAWAREAGVPEDVLNFIEASPGVFDDPVSNPRAWTMVGKVLSAPGDDALLPALVAGIVGDTWAEAFLASRAALLKPLTGMAIVGRYPMLRSTILRAVKERKLDVVSASLAALQRHLKRETNYRQAMEEPAPRLNLQLFVSDLPAEMRRVLKGWLLQQDYIQLASACGDCL